MQNVEWVMGEWVIPLRLLRLLEHLAVLKTTKMETFCLKTSIYSRRELLNSVLPAMPHATCHKISEASRH